MRVKVSTSTRVWAHSLVAAAISASASSISTMLVAPSVFNVDTLSGFQHVVKAALVAAVVGVALLLIKSPLPPPRQMVQEEKQTRDADGNLVSQTSTTKTITTENGGA